MFERLLGRVTPACCPPLSPLLLFFQLLRCLNCWLGLRRRGGLKPRQVLHDLGLAHVEPTMHPVCWQLIRACGISKRPLLEACHLRNLREQIESRDHIVFTTSRALLCCFTAEPPLKGDTNTQRPRLQ